LRFPNEHCPGIPCALPLGRDLARLLGLYCAEGCTTRCKKRPNSYSLNFSFAPGEGELAEQVRLLLRNCLGLEARFVKRPTTLAVCVSKASAALLFKALAGGRAADKRVPRYFFEAPREVVQ